MRAKKELQQGVEFISGPLEVSDIVLKLVNGNTVLDVACGWGRLGYLLRTNWYYTTSKGLSPESLVGIDVFKPTLRRIAFHNIYDNLVCCDARCLPFKANCFEVVLASEIIEHLPKNEGIDFIKELERIAIKTVIISTPNHPGSRGGILLPEGFNPYEHHISRWTCSELEKLGYLVVGRGFALSAKLNYSGVDQRIPRYKVFLLEFLSSFSVLLPQLSNVLVAWKSVTCSNE